ncbi:uncharacterized protein LOC128550297 [Mercenaria mercenaria]|uniref:uncharacterized protein LOC128550297 n=1 Tax=Mercenaria mercenaria TaxID=6596 RepID=UPI00234F8393|nr:uncharacterized protein LOC128550297 [Mercenaria mercenaria]
MHFNKIKMFVILWYILCQYLSYGYNINREDENPVRIFSEDIRDKIADMDDVIRKQSQRIDALDDKVLAQEREIDHMKKIFEDFMTLCKCPADAAATDNDFASSVSDLSPEVIHENERFHGFDHKALENSNQNMNQHTQKRNTETDHVAFSTFLGHWVRLDVGRIIKCNQILTNDGNGYNKFTGIFTVPITGTYFFTFSVCLHHTKVSVRLLRDGQIVSSMSVYAGGRSRSAMSSNSAITHANAGQALWIELFYYTNVTLVSTDEWRCTTFSGFKLY